MDVTNTENRRLRLIEDIEEEKVYYSLAVLKDRGFDLIKVSFLFHLDFEIKTSDKTILFYTDSHNELELNINEDLISEYFKSLFSLKFKHLIDSNKPNNVVFNVDLCTGDYTVIVRSHPAHRGISRYNDNLKNNYNVGNGTKTFN